MVGDAFLADSPAALVLSDNLFHGQDLMPKLDTSNGSNYFELVLDQERYCVVEVL